MYIHVALRLSHYVVPDRSVICEERSMQHEV
jgi:hypothetical protein